MKKTVFLFLIILFVCAAGFAQSARGMSLNGTTGIIAVPSAATGVDKSANAGIDLGYHAIFADTDTASIFKVSVSIAQFAEIAFAYDNQGTNASGFYDLLFSGKIKLPVQSDSGLAIGVNFQSLGMGEPADREMVFQVYFAATYPGTIFTMPVETTLVIGKTFSDIISDNVIDFGMGFDMTFLPDYFKNYIHWIADFANFSYSVKSKGANAWNRGSFNTGIRINLGEIPALSEFKFVVDAIGTDLFDDERTFVLGTAFGFSF